MVSTAPTAPTASFAPTALVVGASRGLGMLLATELARRGWSVTATSRTPTPALETAAQASEGRLQTATVDMADAGSRRRLRAHLESTRLDLLFVNGAVNRSAGSIDDASDEEFMEVMATNALAPLRTIAALEDLVAGDGTIAVMSSEQGSISRNEEEGFEVYKASKAALNQLFRSYANRTHTPTAERGSERALLLIDPGHNRTDLGGEEAPFDPADSMRRVADVLQAARGGAGLRFLDRDGGVVPW